MMSKTISTETRTRPIIKVVAIGGGAIRAQNHMIDFGLQGFDFIAVGSDKYGLQSAKAPTKILIGANRTLGLGQLPVSACRKLAEEAQEIIKRNLDGSDIVLVVTCLGGNTGSGAVPVVASYAREIGALTIAVVTIPFMFEGLRRRRRAETGIGELKENVDALITLSNDALLHQVDKTTPMTYAFRVADESILRSVQKVSDFLFMPGLVNIDFKDVQPPGLNGKGSDNKNTSQELKPDYASRLDRGTLGWIPKSNSDKDREKVEDLMPRTDGKEVCAYLRGIRNDLAKANNISFESKPCDFEGDCAGTCEKCDQEAAYLRDELSKIPEQERKYPEHILKDWNKALCSEK